MKMYILIRDSIPLGNALVAAAHGSLAAYLEFRDSPEVEQWLSGPFQKVTCQVNEYEFAASREVSDHVVITESTLNDQEVAIAFKPRQDWPKAFRFFRLYR